jgi:hypothetical protein
MPLQSSGQISLNDLHVEAGGTSGTQASMNDTDIRGLLNASANSQMTFSSFYGASSAWSTTGTVYTASSKFGVGHQYTRVSNLTYGSIVDQTIDKLNGAILKSVAEFAGSSHTFTFGVYTKADPFSNALGTNEPYIWSGGNSGWSTITFGNLTLSRTSATFSVQNAGQNREYLNFQWSLSGTFPISGLTNNGPFSVSIS